MNIHKTTIGIIITLICLLISNGESLPSYTPYHIHLALGDDPQDIVVSWLTKAKVPMPTVYYYQGSCDDVQENLKNIQKHPISPMGSKLLATEEITSVDANSDILLTNNNHNNQQQYSTNQIKSFKMATGTTTTYFGLDAYIHSVQLTLLSSGKPYCYRVGGEKSMLTSSGSKYPSSWSNTWYSFKTNPLPTLAPTIVAAFADSGTWGNIPEVFEHIASDPDITAVIHAGDLSYGVTEEIWDRFGNLIEPISSQFPYMTIPGNWDVKEGALEPFKNRYKMPLYIKSPTNKLVFDTNNADKDKSDNNVEIKVETANNLFYSYEYGLIYFVMISSYDDYHQGSVQYNWLKQQLEHAASIRHRVPWLIVCAHSPMYSSSSGHDGSDLGFREAVEPLIKKYKVNLVISGHDHGYERTYPVYQGKILDEKKQRYDSSEGTIHILAGTGGATSDPWLDQPDWSLHRETSWGFTKLAAYQYSLEVTYLRTNGSVGDSFVIVHEHAKTSSHTSIFFLLLFLIILIFPICTYRGTANKLFLSVLQHDSYASSSKSMA
ncbi:Purple acid phosphatase [Cavenderia fasciculata]|uniref:Purple acid phosphatase n=1 Tax=Cavenderia fasciculata TaxID=261658 RepID=F4PNQ9_CACFS|nr:Purple acid phosphatase [Cavenderia fasciculata]EGG23112.1 Purple acid phosphatase [Cavenderia fasciculata]|eukprot:XP_004360963.1 Purple acid phosphatase [Cavenderia fasciculata]